MITAITNQTGIWIDGKKAVIVFNEEHNPHVKIIHSLIEGRIRIPGEKKWYTRFAGQFLNFEKKKKNRREMEIRAYLKKVTNEIKQTEEIVLFGPAGMKRELEKAIRQSGPGYPKIKGVETTDSMTENQIFAWVKKYYREKK